MPATLSGISLKVLGVAVGTSTSMHLGPQAGDVAAAVSDRKKPPPAQAEGGPRAKNPTVDHAKTHRFRICCPLSNMDYAGQIRTNMDSQLFS
jgi:hypothetical protein